MLAKLSFCIPFIHEYPSIYSTINNIQTEMKDSPYDWEIIVCENGTVDANTPKAFTGNRALYRVQMSKGKIKYLFSPDQCGPVARNTAARSATGDFVIFMDAHTTLGKDSVEPLADYLTDNPECGGISGLTSWSHYDRMRLGAYYELFGGGGGPTLPTHMHGHYMSLGRVPPPERDSPFPVVMGSQAYTMYRTDEFLDIGGYYDECRFYPHPEGYMPLKMWMTGRPMYVHPDSWHIHGMFPRRYTVSPIETKAKIEEYGGYSWHEHGVRNVLMVAYILGGDKWFDICSAAIDAKHHPLRLEELKKSAIDTVRESGARDLLLDQQETTMNEVLIRARKEHIRGMENWPTSLLGKDPL